MVLGTVSCCVLRWELGLQEEHEPLQFRIRIQIRILNPTHPCVPQEDVLPKQWTLPCSYQKTETTATGAGKNRLPKRQDQFLTESQSKILLEAPVMVQAIAGPAAHCTAFPVRCTELSVAAQLAADNLEFQRGREYFFSDNLCSQLSLYVGCVNHKDSPMESLINYAQAPSSCFLCKMGWGKVTSFCNVQ